MDDFASSSLHDETFDEMGVILERVFDEGSEAAHGASYPLSPCSMNCPYEKGTPEYYGWFNGFNHTYASLNH